MNIIILLWTNQKDFQLFSQKKPYAVATRTKNLVEKKFTKKLRREWDPTMDKGKVDTLTIAPSISTIHMYEKIVIVNHNN